MNGHWIPERRQVDGEAATPDEAPLDTFAAILAVLSDLAEQEAAKLGPLLPIVWGLAVCL